MYQKILWINAVVLLAGLVVWLVRLMPFQAWAQWDGQTWVIVAEGFYVLKHGWPLAVVGALIGSALVGMALAFALKLAKEADFEAEIARLIRERDRAMADAEARVLSREQAAVHREMAALAAHRAAELAREEAQAARQQAEQVQQEAEYEVCQAYVRTRNAIGAAERIKRCIKNPALRSLNTVP